MNETDQKYFNLIRNHLADLHEKWQNDPNSDGHCKSSEGLIQIQLCYPNWFEAGSSKEKYITAEPEVMIEVYSYLFGPHRMHDFPSLRDAWEAIKDWENY